MSKPWLEHYPPGIPHTIAPSPFASLAEFFDDACVDGAALPAYTNFGVTMSYAQLHQRARAFANYLRDDAGLQTGDRVALMMPNLLQYPVALFGTLLAGMTVVNTNPLYTAPELRHQLSDSGAKAIVAVENYASVLAEIRDQLPLKAIVLTGIGDLLGPVKGLAINVAVKYIKKQVPSYDLPDAVSFKQALAMGTAKAFKPVALASDDLAFLQYTGGTTGVAKGAMLSHGNILANVEQSAQWLMQTGGAGKSLGMRCETVITALPLYHIFSLTANCLAFLKLRGHNLLISDPRDLPGFISILRKSKFSCITGVNTLFNGLLNTSGFETIDFSALKLSLGGGMAVQEDVARRWNERTACPLTEAYGLTETSPAVTMNPLNQTVFNHSIGMPILSTDCRINREDGSPASVGDEGELWVKGPQVMQGYWQRPEATAKMITEDGWLRTGDIARMDERGYFYLVDRLKDIVVVSGFNVYPTEVEQVLNNHPQVLECGVIGVPDERSGEAVMAVVVRNERGLHENALNQDSLNQAPLNQEALRSWARESLAAYKIPKHIEFSDELPKSNVGKILRRELVARHNPNAE
ncbi:MAG: AMP-binding protein [Porticoccaceae bacterium]|nr:AMP-binding protein [Porticoccaceae bacterium]